MDIRPFFFVMNAEPTSAASNAADISSGVVHVWVMSSSQKEAEAMARAHILDYGWITKGVEHELTPTREQIADLDDDEMNNFLRCVQYGISADFLCWPKVPRDPDSPIEVCSMGPPVIKKGEQ